MKQILILGGTGAMGRHLVTQLLAMGGVFLTITSRSPHQGDKSKSHEYVVGDAHDGIFINSLLSKCHWDAIIDFMIYSTSEFSQKVNSFLSATDQYIFLSSARVYANSESPITENSPRLLDNCNDAEYMNTDEYALTKARQEDILKNSGKSNWTIIRPYVTFSENRIQLSPQEKEIWLYRALHGRSIVFSKDLASRVTTLTYGYDVSKGIASLIGDVKALGEAFHITSDENYSWEDILNHYLYVIERETGCRPRVSMENDWKPYHGGGQFQIKFDREFDRFFNNDKIKRLVHFSASPVFESIDKSLTNFIHHPGYGEINWAI